VCLPVLARLWHPRQTGKLVHARVMVELVAARYPDRSIHAVGDAAYVGDHLRGLDKRVTWTSRLKVTSVLHQLAPPRTGRSGRPRTKGPGWAHRPTWPLPPAGAPRRFAATGGSTSSGSRRSYACGTGRFAVRPCGWCWSATTSPAPGIVMIAARSWLRPAAGDHRPAHPGRAHGHWTVTRYAWRWAIEVAFFHARQVLGVGQARNWTRQAAQRTVPFGLLCLSLVTVWYATAGHAPPTSPNAGHARAGM